MLSAAVFSPAKINLFLAVTGRRPDGFHDLVSIVAPLSFGDTLWVTLAEHDGPVTLACDDPAVPAGPDNLAVRAAEAWRAATGTNRAVHVQLAKRIPMGAGLGGGSSNAVAVLRALDSLVPRRLDRTDMVTLAAGLGSDCPLFLAGGPCVMRGRGERLEPLPDGVRARLRGQRLMVFKPDFGISTPWAYGRLAAAQGAAYLAAEEAERRVRAWIGGTGRVAQLLFNSFERVAFEKFQALPVVLDKLRGQPGVQGGLMSGSGSACFALLDPEADVVALRDLVRTTLGEGAFVVDATTP